MLERAEEDTNGDGRIDKWEDYDHTGQVRSVAWAFARSGDAGPSRDMA